MHGDSFYSSQAWRDLREQVLARDDGKCTVARLLGGACSNRFDVHHIAPLAERPELALDGDNCATVCKAHHRQWESIHMWMRKVREPRLRPCRHNHPYRAGRLACLNQRRRQAGLPPLRGDELQQALMAERRGSSKSLETV